jgi:asparagine synthase (glutamine-hydrolysing)
MCGIAGFWMQQPDCSYDELSPRLQTMIHTLHHRGPDDQGTWTDGCAGLAHARLSIIDLTGHAHQPMHDGDDQIHLVFNGEIYNFQELRADLEKAGHRFHSHSDTEVIVYGYKEWGLKVLDHLRGMFAFALWDSKQQLLLLARDRVGKKPLFYHWHDNTLLFASEIKAILTWPGVKREADLEGLHHYLTHQYVPAPWSAFKGIKKLPAAHYFVVENGHAADPKPYWRLPSPRKTKSRPIEELKEELLTNLKESVRLRMISDVPLGAFLSGGVDSSAIVAMMAQQSSEPVKTFSIGFEEEEYDETRYARMVAERYETDHHELIVRPDALAVLPKLIWYYNEPFADPSAIPTYYVSEMARRHVTVALNGDGGDESFLGYRRYMDYLSDRWQRQVPLPLRALSGVVADRITPVVKRFGRLGHVQKVLQQVSGTDAEFYARSIVYFYEQDKVYGYGEAMQGYLESSALKILDPYFAEAPSMLAGTAWADIHTYLPDDLLVKVDIASMAHSLEARSPLLDHKLMEWAATIPANQKVWGTESKALLKSAMEDHLPHDVIYRPKMGFGVPIDHWLRKELKELAYDTLLSQKTIERGLFDAAFVKGLLDKHCSKSEEHHTRIWALLIMELWYQMWIDPPQGASLPLSASQLPPLGH